MFWKYLIVVIISYFVGNISFARIISKFIKEDITQKGSGNPGTMNMMRSFGFKLGLLTLFLDALKGSIGALFGFFVLGGASAVPDCYIGMYVGGLSTILGHIYPVLYNFKGGKGVATTLGLFMVANPLWTGISFVFCFFYLLFFDYGSVASFILITTLTVVESVKHGGNVAISIMLFAIFFFTWFAHRQNILRLLLGKENKVNFRKSLQKLQRKKFGKEQAKLIDKEKKKEEKEKSIG
ncbi:MAG: glycerol-3-phosphate acyltransferase [Clostridia bacterium]